MVVSKAYLEHGEEVTHDAAQQPVVDQEHEQGHGQRDRELQQRRQHRAQHAALDGAVAIQPLPAIQSVLWEQNQWCNINNGFVFSN